MAEASVFEYVVIGLYLVFMVITGIAFRRFNRNFSDYFRGGCRGTWWLVGASVFMATFTAWTFTGAAGVAYDAGLVVTVIYIGNAIGYFTNFLITARLFRQMRAITFPEVIRQRFDTPTQQVYVWFGMMFGIMTASLTLLGVAVFASAVFGFPIAPVILMVGVVIVAYSTVGGSWGVMATDFLQALILLPLTVLIMYLSLRSIGGVGGFVEQIHIQGLERMLRFVDTREGADLTIWWAVALIVFQMITFNSMGSSVKYFACKDGREASRAAALAGILMLGGAALWFIPPMVARLQLSETVNAIAAANPAMGSPQETSYAVIAARLLPNGMIGMVVVAMFAATMSSLSTQLNQAAAIFTQDFYKRFLRSRASDREMFVGGQVASVAIGLLIIAFALYLYLRASEEGIFDYMLMFGGHMGTPTLVPMFLALFFRRTPPWSAMVSFLFGLGVSGIAWYQEWNYQWTVLSIVAVGAVAFLLTTPFYELTPDSEKRRISDFYRRMFTPVDFEKEIGKPNDPHQLKLVGYVSMSIGIFMLGILLVPNTVAGRLQVFLVAASIALFGGLMILTGHLKARRMHVQGVDEP